MTTRTLAWTFEELGRAMNKSLEVEIECDVSQGSPGSYWEPPEPPEIEFTDVTIISLTNADSEISVAPSWHPFLVDIAFDLAEKHRDRLEETLSENIGDYDDWAMDDYYDRKRDEQRGC